VGRQDILRSASRPWRKCWVGAVGHYQCNVGADSSRTYVKEWETVDLASWQAMWERAQGDPAWAEREALDAEDDGRGITMDQRNEFYTLIEV
jgi:hypothetical protein